MPTQPYYSKAGKKLPSVTQIISVGLGGYSKDQLLHWAWKEGKEGRDYRESRNKAADAGTLAHLCIEHHMRGEHYDTANDPPEIVPEALAAFGAFQGWSSGHEIELIEQEMPLISERHGFAGCPDGLVRLDGVVTLLDYKTSKAIYSSYIVQLAAYVMLISENRPKHKWPRQAVIIRIGKDGSLNVLTFQRAELQLAWDIFLHAKAIYHARYDLDKLAKPAAVAAPVVHQLPTAATKEVKIA